MRIHVCIGSFEDFTAFFKDY